LPDHLFLHTVWGSSYASNPGWADWFSAKGVNRNPALAAGHQVEMSSSAIQLASLGIGVSLAQVELAKDELESGLLIQISDHVLPLGQAYHAIFPHARAQFQSLKSLVDCL
jgi:LysR family glycine cleavage system transcriptional activator